MDRFGPTGKVSRKVVHSEIWGAIHSTKILNSYRNIIVYPLDMCIPVHGFLVICVSLQYGCQKNVYPLPPQNWREYFFDLLRRPQC